MRSLERLLLSATRLYNAEVDERRGAWSWVSRGRGVHACVYREPVAMLRSFAAAWASTLPVMSRLSVGHGPATITTSRSLAAVSTLRWTARAPTESISLAGTSAGCRGASGPAAGAYAHRQALELPSEPQCTLRLLARPAGVPTACGGRSIEGRISAELTGRTINAAIA